MRDLCLLCLAATIPFSPALASAMDGIRPELIACFTTEDASQCARALDLTERLQRRAASRERFPCQSLLLGLQAEVVMVQLSEGRSDRALRTLQESDRLCWGL